MLIGAHLESDVVTKFGAAGLRDNLVTVARVFEHDRRERCNSLAIAGDVEQSIAHEIDVRGRMRGPSAHD